MNINALLDQLNNKTLLLILMIVLIVFVILLTVLGVIFITALRKRRPVVKVVMAPMALQNEPGAAPIAAMNAEDTSTAEDVAEASVPVEELEPEEDEDDEEASLVVTEGHESVRYNRSFVAKLCQLNNETKEWYSSLKNDLLSYDKVKDRTSWRRETYRLGRNPVARIAVRGKTLCLFLAVEPLGYNGTKYTVEDVSNVANTVDTPTMYRIKSARRLKYAKEMIAGMMKEFKAYKKPIYDAQDFFVPYEGDVSLMQRGLVKRVVSGTTRSFKIEEMDD